MYHWDLMDGEGRVCCGRLVSSLLLVGLFERCSGVAVFTKPLVTEVVYTCLHSIVDTLLIALHCFDTVRSGSHKGVLNKKENTTASATCSQVASPTHTKHHETTPSQTHPPHFFLKRNHRYATQ